METEEKDVKRKEIRQRIGMRVAALRKHAGLSQEQLSEKAGLQRTHVSRIEKGRYSLNIETLQAIAEAIGMTVDIVDQRLEGLAPMKMLTPPIKGALGEALESKVTETFKVGD